MSKWGSRDYDGPVENNKTATGYTQPSSVVIRDTCLVPKDRKPIEILIEELHEQITKTDSFVCDLFVSLKPVLTESPKCDSNEKPCKDARGGSPLYFTLNKMISDLDRINRKLCTLKADIEV